MLWREDGWRHEEAPTPLGGVIDLSNPAPEASFRGSLRSLRQTEVASIYLHGQIAAELEWIKPRTEIPKVKPPMNTPAIHSCPLADTLSHFWTTDETRTFLSRSIPSAY
jgi:hypothetical protein